MFKPSGALSARSVILAAVAVLAISLVWTVATILRPNDSGGLLRDSYGTRARGYRALYETLEELGVPVARSASPPSAERPTDQTLLLLAPNERLVQVGPKYLAALLVWVERGGRLVVAPAEPLSAFDTAASGLEELAGSPEDVLDALDLEDILRVDTEAQIVADAGSDGDEAAWVDEEAYDFIPEELRSYWREKHLASRIFETEAAGSFQSLAGPIRSIALPADERARVVAEDEDLSGRLTIAGDDEEEVTIAAAVTRGEGEIIVVADPQLFSNYLVAQADNSVLAAHLLAPAGQAVLFDEFYHGLSVRGNPFYLLTYPSFATVVCLVLLAVATWAWRSATFLGPPLPARETSRRNLGEYVDAMGQFFSRGPGSRRFLVHEIREGVLRDLCRRLSLPLDTPDEDKIISRLAQRDQQRASRLATALGDVDRRLSAPGEYPKPPFLTDVQRLAACL